MRDLSVLIPARNELFVNRTIEDVLGHAELDTEVICVLDGVWPVEPIKDHPRLVLVHHSESIGQRAATNEAARISGARYVMKLDAHCAMDQGFDRKLIEDMQPGWCLVPAMRNLHAFDWVCANGHRRYQGPSGPCKDCGEPTEREIVWIAKTNPISRSYCFDNEPHFQYFREFNKRKAGKGDLTETMSLQGSCFLMTREMYFDLNVCDEVWGSWGSQGIEVACKVWLSGGRCIVSDKTWYGHMFRTQGGDFGFPYSLSGKQVEHAKKTARDLFYQNKWPRQIHPLSWLVEKFWPVPGWTNEDLAKLKAAEPTRPSKGIVYYTDNRLDGSIMAACQRQLERIGLPITAVSLQPVEGFGTNIVMDAERGPLTLLKQQLAGVEASDADTIFFCEHDVLYHPSHFDFVPPRDDVFFYNTNVWKVRADDGHAVWTDDLQQTSGLCAKRQLLLDYLHTRIAHVEANGFDRHYEPGPKTGGWKAENWRSEWPNVDVRHEHNMTRTKWSPDEFRNRRYARGWREADEVPGWGRVSFG